MPEREISRTFVNVPERPARTILGGLTHVMKGIFLGPIYWLLATMVSLPGARFRTWCFVLGLGGLLGLRRRLPLRTTFHLLFMPMESTLYFEFDFVLKMLAGRPMERYLDVSSPRLIPLYLLDTRSGLTADLLNPDPRDLEETGRFVKFINVHERCTLHRSLIADAPLAPATFDVITSISVLEHIPEDLAAVQQIWNLLKPGGVFVLTVPCMAKASEQYIDRDEWGVLSKNSDGHVFWQRFYDQHLLELNVFRVTGRPQHVVVYGEKVAGSLVRNSERKRSDPAYPYWREPYMMATEYRYFDRLDELPGEGVIGFLFVKSGGA
jgi:SAM-dependent methyltransferase